MGYYRTVTGPVRVETVQSELLLAAGEEPKRILQVLSLTEFVTCRECFADPRIREWVAEAQSTGVTDT